jgi:hypothetical protein
VGRVYQQTFPDTYTKLAFAKLYDRKPPLGFWRAAENFEAWLESNGRPPAEMALKTRLRELLTESASNEALSTASYRFSALFPPK